MIALLLSETLTIAGSRHTLYCWRCGLNHLPTFSPSLQLACGAVPHAYSSSQPLSRAQSAYLLPAN